MLKKITILISTIIMTACSLSKQGTSYETPDNNQINTNNNIAEIKQEPVVPCEDIDCFILRHSEISVNEWENFFSRAQLREDIIRTINRPSTSRPWYKFAVDNSGTHRIKNGTNFYKNNYQIIQRIAHEYGVDAEVITAILGIETNYGKNTGSFNVADSLHTLAFHFPKRAEFFQEELSEFLLMCKELNRDPFSFSGSYAGAMGMPQFMPSSYRKWAKDGDGDGFADIWNNKADALASIANYLVVHGWQKGGRITIPIYDDNRFILDELSEEKTALSRTVRDLRNLGINIPAEINDNERAFVYRLETAPDTFTYHLGFNNFYAIWKYNNSRLYVHAVSQIAAGIYANQY